MVYKQKNMNKLSKLLSILLLSLGAGAVANGKGVDETTAKNAGCHYLMSQNVSGVESVSDLSTAYVATDDIGGSKVADFYIFNVASGNGWVLVTADDRVMPVLAFSDKLNFDINTAADAAKIWIKGYQDDIAYIIEHNIPPAKALSRHGLT